MTRLTILAFLLLSACTPATPPEGSAAEGALFFAENCSGCHGTDGKGNGPDAAGLELRPADLTQIAARNGGSFPGDWVMNTIDGFHRDAPAGTAMPVFGADRFDDVIGDTIIVERTEGIGTPIPVMFVALESYLASIQE